MKKADVRLGGVYAAKVSGHVVPVKLTDHYPYGEGGWWARNLATGKRIVIRSAARLRFPVEQCPVCDRWAKNLEAHTKRAHNKEGP